MSDTAAQALVCTRRQLIAAGVFAAAGASMGRSIAASEADPALANDELSHSAEAIHQERLFQADRKRVYQALTLSRQFDQVTQLSGAMRMPALAKMQHRTAISRQPGGAFALFGGYITGRHIELVPDELIVQAWRVGNWQRGVYSVVRFELIDQGGGTKLVFDHTAFPKGKAEELASGWQDNYWSPLAKFLAKA
jgi:uncharacterized protein YndB with AHSA1/START domain